MKEKGIKILLAISIFLASFLMPFSVSAETITQSNIIGTNVWTTPISTEQFNGYAQNTAMVSVEIQLDQAYLGWINLGVTVDYKNYYYGANNPYWGDTSKTFSGNYYVNGSTVLIEIPITWNSLVSNYQMGSPTHLPDSSSDITLSLSNQGNVTPIGDLSTLQDILEVLQDIKQNVEIDVMGELQDIVIALGLSNQYLEKISKYRQWNVPFESMGFISYLLSYGYEEFEFRELEPYNFPLFKVPKNNNIYGVYLGSNKGMTFVFGSSLNLNYPSAIINLLNLPSNITVENIKVIDTIYFKNVGYQSYSYICRFDIVNKTSSGISVYLKSTTTDLLIIPIFARFTEYVNQVSTDFALKFGLSNQLLDDIHVIAQGTTASNSAASGLENQNSQMADDMDDLATIENGYNQQFNQQLQNIDFTNPITNNQGILPAANFVITVFNGLISNNPFSVLIIIVCILLIGKRVIGK